MSIATVFAGTAIALFQSRQIHTTHTYEYSEYYAMARGRVKTLKRPARLSAYAGVCWGRRAIVETRSSLVVSPWLRRNSPTSAWGKSGYPTSQRAVPLLLIR